MIKTTFCSFFLALYPLLLTPFTSKAQKADEIKSLFPGEQAVILNQTSHYTIKIKDGEPQAESTEVQDIMYLSDNAGSFMSKYSFYHSSFHQVMNYKAYTITASGKKAEVKDFKTTHNVSESVFYDDVKQTSFDFPSLSPGSVGHLEYTTTHSNPRLLSPHYFSRFIPVINGELKITFPKNMSLKYLIRGNNKEQVQFSSETKKSETTYLFKVKNLAKEQNYADAPDNSYYSLHVIFYIESYIANDNQVKYMAGLDDMYRLNWSFVENINKEISPDLKKITDSLISGIDNKEERAKRIYKWVQQNIKYVAFEEGMGGFIPREASLVCNRRFGDCKDMSSILTVMLNHAAVPAYYTWIGTRSLPYDYTEVHLPITDNHMITTVRLNDKFVFLDGTDSYCIFGAPSGHIQGKQALIAISKEKYEIARVPEYEKGNNLYIDTTILELNEKGLTGNIRLKLSGYMAMDMNRKMNYINEKNREDYLRDYLNRGSNKFKLIKSVLSPAVTTDEFNLTGQFELQDYGKKVGDEWYLNMNLFKFYEHQEIDYPKRKIPIEFEYKTQSSYVTILKIPPGYTISYLPESKSFHNETWGFDMIYQQNQDMIILTQNFESNHLLLSPDKFESWNKVLEHLFPLYRETISFTKNK